MKYFKCEFESTTKHPNHPVGHVFYASSEKKCEAAADFEEMLFEEEARNCMRFRSAKISEIEKDEYIACTVEFKLDSCLERIKEAVKSHPQWSEVVEDGEDCVNGFMSIIINAFAELLNSEHDINEVCEKIRTTEPIDKLLRQSRIKSIADSSKAPQEDAEEQLEIDVKYQSIFDAVKRLVERGDMEFSAHELYKNIEDQIESQGDIDLEKVIIEIDALKNPAVLTGTTACQLVMKCWKIPEKNHEILEAIKTRLSMRDTAQVNDAEVDMCYANVATQLSNVEDAREICEAILNLENCSAMFSAVSFAQVIQKFLIEKVDFDVVASDESEERLNTEYDCDVDIASDVDVDDVALTLELNESDIVYSTVEQLNERLSKLERGESLIVESLENEIYHGCMGYSKSDLDKIAISPSFLKFAKHAPRDESKEAALSLGTAVHTAILEPELFEQSYAIEPSINARTNAGKAEREAFETECAELGKQVLKAPEFKKIDLMKRSVMSHPNARVFNDGDAEVSIFWREPESGLILKIRPDWISSINGQDFIIDLKTCSGDFSKSIEEYRYHVQDAFYSYVYEQATGKPVIFGFCVVSSSINCGRYDVHIGSLDEHDKQVGESLFKRDLAAIAQCEASKNWSHFETFQRPAWARKYDEVA